MFIVRNMQAFVSFISIEINENLIRFDFPWADLFDF